MEGLIFSLRPLIVGKIMSLFLLFVRVFLLCWNNRSSSGPHVICDHNHYSKPTAKVLLDSRFSSRFFSYKLHVYFSMVVLFSSRLLALFLCWWCCSSTDGAQHSPKFDLLEKFFIDFMGEDGSFSMVDNKEGA